MQEFLASNSHKPQLVQRVWEIFTKLNSIPRKSGKEEAIAAYVSRFCKKLGVELQRDTYGNLVVSKPAFSGRENAKKIALQAHLDMVCSSNNEEFNFDTQGIEMYTEGDWVRAKETTLGADNGIAVAAILAVLESKDLKHGPLEAVFTLNEETGLHGAKNFDLPLQADYMLNLDTEDDEEFCIACAGGADTLVHHTFPMIVFYGKPFEIRVEGLIGGHSGGDIHLERGNSNKILAEVLQACTKTARISSFSGGNLRNEIPRKASAIVIVRKNTEFTAAFNQIATDIRTRFLNLEPNLSITLTPTSASTAMKVMKSPNQNQLLSALLEAFNGVWKMSELLPNLTETSSNLAKMKLERGVFTIDSLQRSLIDAEKEKVVEAFAAPFRAMGATIEYKSSYSGWLSDPQSPLLAELVGLYTDMFKKSPVKRGTHGGLETGIFKGKFPKMELASFGPNIQGAHSPDERLSIRSVEEVFVPFLSRALETL